LAVTATGEAVDALRLLRAEELGQATMAISGDDQPQPRPDQDPSEPDAPAAGRWAATLVRPADGLTERETTAARNLIARLLGRTAVTDHLADAQTVVAADPSSTAVTADGDLLSGSLAAGGSGATPSLIELAGAKAEAEDAITAGTAAMEELAFRLKAASDGLAEAERAVAQSLEALTQSDAKHAAVADRLGHLAATVGAQRDLGRKAQARLDEAQAALVEDQAALTAVAEELEAARTAPGRTGHDTTEQGAGTGPDGIGQRGDEPDPAERDRLSAAARAARQALTEATLEARDLDGRVEAITTRIAATERAAQAEREAEAKARTLAERRAAQADVARGVELAAGELETLVARAAQEARGERDQAEAARAEREAETVRLRGELDQSRAELAEITGEVHRDELARAAGQAKLDGLAARARDDLGLTVEDLTRDYGPDQAVPDPADPTAEPRPYSRPEQEKRLRRAERELATLGRVNPLALEEYAALEERHKFLTAGLDDIKRSRTDLMRVIHEIDGRVEQIFANAYQDTAEAFTHVFARLFPGGEGRLIATVPSDWLTTGVDIEARPAGKAVKRLSLLSGGERSLVAVAFTLAIFLARPSPFYVMDEVEAALDETNLGRLLSLIEELRDSSQVLMVTHQKRSMEIADALYGVTMRDDGVSTVISQRLTRDGEDR
jgi:chromosome segregation protein